MHFIFLVSLHDFMFIFLIQIHLIQLQSRSTAYEIKWFHGLFVSFFKFFILIQVFDTERVNNMTAEAITSKSSCVILLDKVSLNILFQFVRIDICWRLSFGLLLFSHPVHFLELGHHLICWQAKVLLIWWSIFIVSFVRSLAGGSSAYFC